jgi:hypothetical protein
LRTAWNALSYPEQTAWNEASRNFPYSVRGNSNFTMSGMNYFISQNNAMLKNGGSIETTPGYIENDIDLSDVVIALNRSGPTLTINKTGGSLASGQSIMVYMYAPIPMNNKLSFQGERILVVVPHSATLPYSLLTAYTNAFPLPSVLQQIPILLNAFYSTPSGSGYLKKKVVKFKAGSELAKSVK